MSSLASLAHAAEPAFNGLFYATVATIIPVLFLALAVQGRTSENLVKVTMNADKRRRRGTWKYLGGDLTLPRAVAAAAATVAANAPLMIAAFIVIFGVHGEINGLLALYYQRASATTGGYVLDETIFLLVALAAVAVWTFARTIYTSGFEQGRDMYAGRAASGPGDSPEAEPDKTDAD